MPQAYPFTLTFRCVICFLSFYTAWFSFFTTATTGTAFAGLISSAAIKSAFLHQWEVAEKPQLVAAEDALYDIVKTV
jgi:hypothetical protein